MTQAQTIADLAQGVSTAQMNGGAVSGLKEKIINGRMEIDQRNGGAAINFTANGGPVYGLDRMQYYSYSISNTGTKGTLQQNAGSVTPPPGFVNYWGLTSSTNLVASATDVHILAQRIEGTNITDMAQGTASAKDFTVTFWVRASQAGSYGGSLFGGGLNYVFQYTIYAANTWERKSILIPGCTTGTWVTNNVTGLNVFLDVGSGTSSKGASGSWGATNLYSVTGGVSVLGTSGATFYITGLSLKAGDCRNEIYNEWRPYALEELLCLRYLPVTDYTYNITGPVAFTVSTGSIRVPCLFKVPARVRATGITMQNATAWTYSTGGVGYVASSPTYYDSTVDQGYATFTLGSAAPHPSIGVTFTNVAPSGKLLWTGCEL